LDPVMIAGSLHHDLSHCPNHPNKQKEEYLLYYNKSDVFINCVVMYNAINFRCIILCSFLYCTTCIAYAYSHLPRVDVLPASTKLFLLVVLHWQFQCSIEHIYRTLQICGMFWPACI
jgi:hypothetical protein